MWKYYPQAYDNRVSETYFPKKILFFSFFLSNYSGYMLGTLGTWVVRVHVTGDWVRMVSQGWLTLA